MCRCTRPRRGPRYAHIKRVRLPVDTRMWTTKMRLKNPRTMRILRDRVRRGPLREVLLWTMLVAGAIWTVPNAIVQVRFAGLSTGRFASSPSSVFIWAQAAAAIANSVFLVALGSYIALWLALREDSS